MLSIGCKSLSTPIVGMKLSFGYESKGQESPAPSHESLDKADEDDINNDDDNGYSGIVI
jgi:hypothetical protein